MSGGMWAGLSRDPGSPIYRGDDHSWKDFALSCAGGWLLGGALIVASPYFLMVFAGIKAYLTLHGIEVASNVIVGVAAAHLAGRDPIKEGISSGLKPESARILAKAIREFL